MARPGSCNDWTLAVKRGHDARADALGYETRCEHGGSMKFKSMEDLSAWVADLID